MEEIKISNFEELHRALKKYHDDKRWYFRGHSNPEWKLLPKVGRHPYLGIDEKAVFESWKRAAIEYVSSTPNSDWEWLAIAQHHGLATRLLDWSTNPLNACYFALREPRSSDAIVYAGKFKWAITDTTDHPLDKKRLAVFRPQRVVPRITRQGGLFTIHPKPSIDLESGVAGVVDLNKIVIAKEYRELLQSELSYYGVNSATLFPDLDGLSMFVNWTIEKKEYWRYPAPRVEPTAMPFG
jgi:hypothetical protein